jgi:hypothetical protein
MTPYVDAARQVSSTLGEERSAKRGAVSIHILDETDGIGGLKDRCVLRDVMFMLH